MSRRGLRDGAGPCGMHVDPVDVQRTGASVTRDQLTREDHMARSTTPPSPVRSRPRPARLAAAIAALAVALVGVAMAMPAAAESFRYWGYYSSDGSTWAFAQTGPADAVPADGAVEGWRFAVADEASTRVPRAEPDFATLCGSASAEDGMKRVGVVIDYGTAQDAPEGDTAPAARGACAVVDTDASGSDVLAAVADLRVGDGGFVCGIDGYPTQGCGDPVDGPAPSSDEEPVELELATSDSGTGSASWLPVVLGLAAVIAIAAAALLVARRRSDDSPGTPGA